MLSLISRASGWLCTHALSMCKLRPLWVLSSNLSAISHPGGAKLPVRPVFEAVGVVPMRGHHAMEGGSTGSKPFLLGLIAAQNQAHELTHAVP